MPLKKDKLETNNNSNTNLHSYILRRRMNLEYLFERYLPKDLPPSLQQYIEKKGLNCLWFAMAEIMTLFMEKQQLCHEAISDLSKNLYIALNKVETGLADKLQSSYPSSKEETLLNDRSYPQISSLNPQNIKIKKHSILKKILFEFIAAEGLISKDLLAPDKYLFYVAEDEVLTSGLYEEAMFTLFPHGKLTHLIQMYCIIVASKNKNIELYGLDLPTLLQALICIKNEQGIKLWDEVLDIVADNSVGYRCAENLFSYLLNLNNCLGSYMRASLDAQLNRVATLYHQLPLDNVSQITPALIFQHAAMADNQFLHAITPSCNAVLNLAVHYYKSKNSDAVKPAGPGYIIEHPSKAHL